MASSSSMGSPAANVSSCDVFLSFRGIDTRDAFTDHLFEKLVEAGIDTFRDNEEITKGQDLKAVIKGAIKLSKGSIVVLSENYATSTWCLEELWLILEEKKERGHFVIPVFYHVDPSDVRKQENTFKLEVKIGSKWTEDNVNRWKAALTEVADLSGLVVSGPETKCIKKIVGNIYNNLDPTVQFPSNLMGIATRYEDISSWLNQSNVKVLAICGMGGSGKTTLAKYIYDSNCKKFENTSFIEDIGRTCEQPNGLLKLQKKLLKDILGPKKREVSVVSQGTRKIEKALQTKRRLIVLDDITEHSQLVDLLGSGRINAESKIIITTKENTDNWRTCWTCQCYEMILLDDNESLELLSHHAFGSKSPMEGFMELSMQAVRYCGGNPLALKVLASSLSNSNTILHWESQLKLLEKDIHSGIHGVLVRSYMSLPYDHVKELFLHIACFFIGKDMDYVAKILEHDYSAICGIKTLVNRYLLSVSPNKKLMMHRLLQEMGKDIVRQESRKYPERRSRIWVNSDSYKILSKGNGSETIEGLALDIQMLRKEKDALQLSSLTTDALKKMDKLKLLQLNFVELEGSYEKMSEDLRWLCWHGFCLSTIPSNLFMGNLVALDMSFSCLEVFEPPMALQSLQILNLKGSENLSEIRNISRLPNLGTLILWNCHRLVHECGASLVYSEDEVAEETSENNTGLVELFGGDLARFQLSTGAYYLCRRDFSELMEVGRLTPGWFRVLVGDTIDYTEVRGWRKTGRPNQSGPSFTELKTVRCIIHGPEPEEIYRITEMSKSSLVDKTVEFTSIILRETTGVDFNSRARIDKLTNKVDAPQGVRYVVADTEGPVTVRAGSVILPRRGLVKKMIFEKVAKTVAKYIGKDDQSSGKDDQSSGKDDQTEFRKR